MLCYSILYYTLLILHCILSNAVRRLRLVRRLDEGCLPHLWLLREQTILCYNIIQYNIVISLSLYIYIYREREIYILTILLLLLQQQQLLLLLLIIIQASHRVCHVCCHMCLRVHLVGSRLQGVWRTVMTDDTSQLRKRLATRVA